MRQKDLRKQILEERGLVSHQRAKGKGKRLVTILPTMPTGSKTTLMELLEARHHKDIRELLITGSLTVIAENLGIDFTTVSKWKKRLGLNGMEVKDGHK